MKLTSCEHESQVIVALESGSFPAALQSHIEACPTCQDVVLVAQFLRHATPLPAENVPLPGASLIWWRAQLAEKRSLANRSVAPIRLTRKLALVALLLVALFYALQAGPELFDKTSPLLTAAVSAALLLVLLTASVSHFGQKLSAQSEPRT